LRKHHLEEQLRKETFLQCLNYQCFPISLSLDQIFLLWQDN
jgi:hypothetical protein